MESTTIRQPDESSLVEQHLIQTLSVGQHDDGGLVPVRTSALVQKLQRLDGFKRGSKLTRRQGGQGAGGQHAENN